MRLLVSALAGALFGIGLLISGMADPSIVLGFFDVAGTWNPQLAFVIGGALAVMVPAWRLARMRREAWTGGPLPGPASTIIDTKLLGGSALFGVGWGLSGLCPAPSLVALGFGGAPFWAFAAAMCVGLLLPRLIASRRSATA